MMSKIEELYSTYGDRLVSQIRPDEITELKDSLAHIEPSDLLNGSTDPYKSHLMYLELLQKVRRFSAAGHSLDGKNALKTQRDSLSVGRNGIYTDENRFIYELIQNADDCKYPDPNHCEVVFDFIYDTPGTMGKIVMTSNESGFKPKNVLGITGLAEESKNTTSDIEIGEKGIGFKSVFGITDEVLIQSGYFSFYLRKPSDDVKYDPKTIWNEIIEITVPLPNYEGYQKVDGTRITFTIPKSKCKSIYEALKKRYSDPANDALVKENPIVFLKQLARLELRSSDKSSILFTVDRNKADDTDSMQVENGVQISFSCRNSDGQTSSRKVDCYRYTKRVKYDLDKCKSRYGNDIKFDSKQHYIIALIPKTDCLSCRGGGMYSFLPTKINIAVPVMLHVPFKLDVSREYVDDQNNNAWFGHTYISLVGFMGDLYRDLAHKVGKDIVRYLLRKSQDLFIVDNNGKVANICGTQSNGLNLRGEQFCKMDVFQTKEGFCGSDKVICFGEQVSDPLTVRRLLGLSKSFFDAPSGFDMSKFGVEVIEDVYSELFKRALSEDAHFSEIIDIIEKGKPGFDYSSVFDTYCKSNPQFVITYRMIAKSVNVRRLYEIFTAYARKIKDGITPPYSIQKVQKVSDNRVNGIEEDIVNSGISENTLRYWYAVRNNVYAIDPADVRNLEDKGVFIAGKDSLALVKGNEIESFAELIRLIDGNKVIYSRMILRQISEKLGDYDNYKGPTGDADYFKLVCDERNTTYNVLGKTRYDAFLKAIKEVGSDKDHFIHELIQNADDCFYSTDEPTFTIELSGRILRTYTNENGFTKEDLRSITAIGESSKTSLLNDRNTIGEKGLGFKSIFRVASSVEIRSGNFAFRLTADKPTIPEELKHSSSFNGTEMLINLDEDVRSALNVDAIARLCVCLNKLRKVVVNGEVIRIDRSADGCTISTSENAYRFDCFRYNHTITDMAALKERPPNKNSPKQQISILLPESASVFGAYYLYAGLPTSTPMTVPMIVNAPFELTSSRGSPLGSRWNTCISEGVVEAVRELFRRKKGLKLDLLQYIDGNGCISADPNLNGSYLNFLSELDFIPTIFGETVTPRQAEKAIVPEFVLDVKDAPSFRRIFGNLIDRTNAGKYIGKLKMLGFDSIQPYRQIRDLIASDYRIVMNRSGFRGRFYSFIKDAPISERLEIIKEHIFPVKSDMGTVYIPFDKEIYYYEGGDFPKGGYYVLETGILSATDANKLLEGTNCFINKLTQEVFDEKYRQWIYKLVLENQDPIQVAETLLKQCNNNYSWFAKSKEILRQLKGYIPIKFELGGITVGPKYVRDESTVTRGTFLKKFIVDKEYMPLAKFLELTSIRNLKYSDTSDFGNYKVEYEDLEDFVKNGLDSEMLIPMKNGNHIHLMDELDSDPDDLAEKFKNWCAKDSATLSKIISDLEISDKVPCKMIDKSSHVKPFYLCNDPDYKGDFLKGNTVCNESGYQDLARILNTSDISSMTYNEELFTDELSVYDLKDLKRYLSESSFKTFVSNALRKCHVAFVNDIVRSTNVTWANDAEKFLGLFNSESSIIKEVCLMQTSLDRGFNDRIPVKTLGGYHGGYRIGCRFIASRDLPLKGAIIQNFIVDHRWDKMGEDLGWSSIENISVVDVSVLQQKDLMPHIGSVSDQDIHDFLDHSFANGEEIVLEWYNNGLITKERMKAFNLTYLLQTTEDPQYSRLPTADFHDLPPCVIESADEVYEELQSRIEYSPNKMVNCQKTELIPSSDIDSEVKTYIEHEYGENDFIHCQMCSVKYSPQFMTYWDVRPEPLYAWKECKIGLCPVCAHKFRIGAGNRGVWDRFVNNIRNATVGGYGLTGVEFNKALKVNIYFTPGQLLRIKGIMKLEDSMRN